MVNDKGESTVVRINVGSKIETKGMMDKIWVRLILPKTHDIEKSMGYNRTSKGF